MPLRSDDWRQRLLALISLPVLILFGWLMFHRLATCPKGIQADFVQEWTSARNYWTGRPVYLPLAESFPQHFGPEARTELKVNAHPPVAVVVALPFGLLEYRAAWLAWNLVSLAVLALCLWLLMPPSSEEGALWKCAPLAALLLTSNPLAQQVIEGQMNLVLLGLIVGAWSADRGARPRVAGMLVGLAAAIKLYPAFLIVYFLARRQWSAVVAAGVTFAAASLLAIGLFGSDVFLIYFRDVLPAFRHYGDNLGNASLPGLWSKAFVGIPGQVAPWIVAPTAVRLATLLGGVLLAAICGWQAWRATDERGRDLAFSAAVVGMLLASPITWGHAFVPLVLPLALVWRHSDQQPLVRGAVGASCILLWLVRPGWIWNALVPGFEELSLGMSPAGFAISSSYALTLLSFPTYALLLLFVSGLNARRAKSRPSLAGASG